MKIINPNTGLSFGEDEEPKKLTDKHGNIIKSLQPSIIDKWIDMMKKDFTKVVACGFTCYVKGNPFLEHHPLEKQLEYALESEDYEKAASNLWK